VINLRKWLKTGLFRSSGTAPTKQSELIEKETSIIKVTYETTGLWESTLQSAGEISFKEIEIPNIGQNLEPGEPSLPQEGLYVAIPAGARVTEIRVISEKKKTFELENPVKPAPQPTVDKRAPPQFIPNKDIYDEKEKAFPGVLFKDLGMKQIGDVQVLHLMIYPVQYRPPKTIELYSKIELEISYELGAEKAIPTRGGRKRLPTGAEDQILNLDNV
jgi:hypothetical protein